MQWMKALAVGIMVFMVACAKLPDTSPPQVVGGGPALVTVNGVEITEGDLAFLADIGPPGLKARLERPDGRQQILNDLIERELLYAESIKRGLQRDPRVLAKTELYKRVIIAEAVLQDALEDNAEQYYEEHAEEFENAEIAHLLIRFGPSAQETTPIHKKRQKPAKTMRTEEAAVALANDIKERLEAGEDFSELAKQLTEDAATKEAGGTLGEVTRNEPHLVRRGFGPLLEHAFTLPVGQLGGPIKTREGYHLLMRRSEITKRPFDEVSQAIQFRLRAKTRRDLVTALKAKAKIKLSESATVPHSVHTPPESGTPRPSATH